MNSFLAFRDAEEKRWRENKLTMGEVTTINLTRLSGGVQLNVVPDKVTAGFDVRIPPTIDFKVSKRSDLYRLRLDG